MLCLLSVFCFMLVFEKIRFVKPGWPGFAGHCQPMKSWSGAIGSHSLIVSVAWKGRSLLDIPVCC